MICDTGSAYRFLIEAESFIVLSFSVLLTSLEGRSSAMECAFSLFLFEKFFLPSNLQFFEPTVPSHFWALALL